MRFTSLLAILSLCAFTVQSMSVAEINAHARRSIVTSPYHVGHMLHRSVKGNTHRYYVNHNNLIHDRNHGWKQEQFVSYTVNDDLYNRLKALCPELRKFHVFHNCITEETWILENWITDHHYKFDGHFYCAPRQGYCGANFEIVNIKRRNVTRDWDLFIPSSVHELNVLINNGGYGVWEDRINQRICWAWK